MTPSSKFHITWTERKMSSCDIVQSLKTGKRLFLWTGQGSAESLHHFPSHQTSQQKKKKVQLPSSCWPLKCVSKGNVKMNDIRVDMAQYSTHLRRKGLHCLTSKTHANINTPRQAFSQSHESEKSLSYKNTDSMPQWVHLLPIHHAFNCKSISEIMSSRLLLILPLCNVTYGTGESLLLTASIKPIII